MNNFERRDGGFVVYRCKEGGIISEQSVQAHLLLAILEQLESIKAQIIPTKPDKIKINKKSDLSATVVVALWNDIFIDTYARQMELITPSRRASIQARIKNEFKTVGDWKGFFQMIQQSDFLMGKVQSGDRKPFKISLDWVCKPSNLAKILEGHYHGR